MPTDTIKPGFPRWLAASIFQDRPLRGRNPFRSAAMDWLARQDR